MAYMDANAVFADGIQELSFDEIEQINGAVAPLLLVAAVIAAGVAGYYVCEYIVAHC